MKRYLLPIIIGFAVLLNTLPAFAASDGTIGATSTGTSVLSLEIPEYVLVTDMDDFAFGTWNGTTALDLNDDIVIAGNDDQSTPTYTVNITGSGASGAFTMARSSPASPAATIAYTVAFNDQSGTSGGVSATAGTDIENQTGIHTSLTTATANANIRVQIALGALQAAPLGTYGGTLTIVVTPE